VVAAAVNAAIVALATFVEAQNVEANARILEAALVQWHSSEIVSTEVWCRVPPYTQVGTAKKIFTTRRSHVSVVQQW